MIHGLISLLYNGLLLGAAGAPRQQTTACLPGTAAAAAANTTAAHHDKTPVRTTDSQQGVCVCVCARRHTHGKSYRAAGADPEALLTADVASKSR